MHIPPHLLPLLADLSRAPDLMQWPRPSERLHLVAWALVVFAAVALVVVGLRIRQALRQPQAHPIPAVTYLSIARSLGLGWVDIWLLWRVARHQSLPTPITLLLSPHTLDHHARAYVATRWRPRQAGLQARVLQVQRRLFGAGSEPRSAS